MKVGIIGTGMMGKCHCLAFKAVKGVFTDVVKPKLEVICDIDEKSALRKAEEFDFARVSTDWRDVVSDQEIDLVSIAAPNRFHREISVAALAAGKHVYCEKPMASRLEDAEAMAEEARRSDRVTLLGYNFAQNPILFTRNALLRKERLGRYSTIGARTTRITTPIPTFLGLGAIPRAKPVWVFWAILHATSFQLPTY